MILPSCFGLPVIFSSPTLMPLSTLLVSAVEGLEDSCEQLPSVKSQSQSLPISGRLLYLDTYSQAGSMSAPKPCLLCIRPKRL